MHAHSLDHWRCEHGFPGEHHARNERQSWAVVGLCGDRIFDLHLWRIGPGHHHSGVMSLVSDRPEAPATYKGRLAGIVGLGHVTVEVQPPPGKPLKVKGLQRAAPPGIGLIWLAGVCADTRFPDGEGRSNGPS